MRFVNKIRIFAVVFSISFFAIQLAYGQQEDKKSFEKGTLINVPDYYGATILQGNSSTRNKMFNTTIFSQTFEGSTTSWLKQGIWGVGRPTGGPNGGYNSPSAAGTNLNGPYLNAVSDTLFSPLITLSASAKEDVVLRFYEWFRLESNFDYGYVIISNDGGESWRTISQRDGQSEWVLNEISLNAYKNDQVNIGFVISTDDSQQFDGWFIDDVQVLLRTKDELNATITSINTREFPDIYMNVNVDTFGVGLPSLEKADFGVTENGVLQQNNFSITPPQESGQVRLADIVFIMDNSGSMSQEQNAVSNNVFSFVDSLSSSGIDFALGLTRYGASENSGNPIFENSGNLTSNAETFKDDIWNRNTINGGFEPGYRSLLESINGFNFRPGAQKIFVIITDERPDQGNTELSEVENAFQNNSITLFVLTENSFFSDYESLVETPSDQIFDIYSSFETILDFISETVSRSYVVSYRSSDPIKNGIERRVQVEVNYEGKQALDKESYIPGSVPDLKRTRSTISYSNKAWAEGTPFNIQVRITDQVEPFVQSATLHYRTAGAQSEYLSVSMQQTGNETFEAVIPEGYAAEPGLEYYLSATDGNSSASTPKVNPSDNPFQIAILPNVAPEITHTPILNSEEGDDVLISANVVDGTNELASVKLNFKESGRLIYSNTEMVEVGTNQFEATIPGSLLTTAGAEYYIEAEDDLGVKSWAPTDRDDPYVISTSNTVLLNLSSVQNGPEPANIRVPKNGSGYIYYQVSSDDGDVFVDEVFSIGLIDDVSKVSYETSARFLEENLLQIQVPYELMGSGTSTRFRLVSTFNLGNVTYSVDSQEGIFTAFPEDQTYTRTWSVFASGSAGVSGSIGSVGIGASVAAARGSIKGTGGVGLELMIDENDDLFIARRMELGVGISASAPAVNPIIKTGDLNVGVSGELFAKAMVGQAVSFDQISGLDEDIKTMAQTGYFLETISLGGASVSPITGVLLRATVNTINELGEVSEFFDPAIVSRSTGFGLEGSLSAGLNFKLGSYSLKAGNGTAGIVLNANYYQYPFNASVENGSVTSGASVSSAFNYQLSSLTWDLKYTDLSFIGVGSGSEVSVGGFWKNTGALDRLEFSVANGAGLDLLGLERSISTSSNVVIPGSYSSLLSGGGSVFNGFINPKAGSITLGTSLLGQLQNGFNSLLTNIDDEEPIILESVEKRGRGIEYEFEASFDAAFVVGGSIDVGMGFQLYDEVQYPKNYVEIYAGGQNYLTKTFNYDPDMEAAELNAVITELFSGTVPLLENAWDNLVGKVLNVIQGNVEFNLTATDAEEETAGQVSGTIAESGQFEASTYSPKVGKVRQKGFDLPEVKNIYTSPNVFYKAKSKSTASGSASHKLVPSGSELIVTSKVMDLSFIPTGDTDPVDELDNSIDLEMEIKEEDLIDSGFDMEDADQVKLYHYDLDSNGWVLVDGEVNNEMVSAEITEMGEYALGIEISKDNDVTAPEIYDFGYNDATSTSNADQIYAKIRDDRYGIGIDLSQSFIILNGDTLDITFQPASERIFYQLRDGDLSGTIENVRIIVSDLNGNVTKKSFTFESISVSAENEAGIPDEFELLNNYPNPFNPQTSIPFTIPEPTHVQINIYDVLGRFVETIFDERVEAGKHEVSWNVTDTRRGLSTGIYFYQIKAGEFNQVKKMTLIK